MSKGKILLIDDEEPMVRSFVTLLRNEGYEVEGALRGEEGRALIIEEKGFDVILCDLNLPDIDGMDLLHLARSICPETVFIIISAYGSIELAVKSLKEGAYDFISKPIQLNELLNVLDRSLEKIRLQDENKALKKAITERYDFSKIIGKSKPITEILELVKKITDTKTNVLITGESGTGKELIARAVHFNSPQASKPFVVVNCSAIPKDLLESELFGHEKGAFTGASTRKKGLFEEADGGTLFLDEIGDLPMDLQVKLLRAVQEGEFRMIGGIELLKVDCRIIAATNKSLKDEVDAGHFRADLFYRLNVVPIHVPPLRERKEDIPYLVRHFLDKCATKLKRPKKGISPNAMDLLMRQSWQGNIRELENLIERAVIFSENRDPIDLKDFPSISKEDPGLLEKSIESKLSIDEYAKAFIQRYDELGYHENEIAGFLGICPKTLWEKRKRWGLERKSHQYPSAHSKK